MKKLLLFLFITSNLFAEDLDIPRSVKDKRTDKNFDYMQDWAQRNHVGSDPVFFRVYCATSTTLVDNVFTKIIFDGIESDINGLFDVANSCFVAPDTGYYIFTASIHILSVNDTGRNICTLYVNGVEHSRGTDSTNSTSENASEFVSIVLYLQQYDYVEVYIFQNNTGNKSINPISAHSYFTGIRLF